MSFGLTLCFGIWIESLLLIGVQAIEIAEMANIEEWCMRCTLLFIHRSDLRRRPVAVSQSCFRRRG
jgi:hypothetical protein